MSKRRSLQKLFYQCVDKNHLEAVKYYRFKHRVNVNQKISGRSLLHIAAVNFSAKMVKLLLSLGADLNIKNRHDKTVLDVSMHLNDYYTIKVLILAGGDVFCRSKDGLTALPFAIWYNDVNFADFLLRRGVSVDDADTKSITPLHYLAFSKKGCTSASVRMYELLLSRCTNPNAKNFVGLAPLHTLAEKGCDREVIEILNKYGTDLNVQMDNPLKETPLHLAVKNGHLRTARALLEFGADIHAKCYATGVKSIHMVGSLVGSVKNDLQMYNLLVRNGADVNSNDNDGGWTPLMYRLMYGYTDSQADSDHFSKGVSFLIENSNLNLIDKNGKNILQIIGRKLVATVVLKQLAISKVSDGEVHESLMKSIKSDEKFDKCFRTFTEELLEAKDTKINDSWVSYFNVLTCDESKLVKFAGNTELINNFRKMILRFPLYGSLMFERLFKGMEIRKLRDSASDKLSELSLEFQNPSIMLNVMKFLTTKDCKKILSK